MQILEIDHDGEELLQGFVRAQWPQRVDMAAGRAAAWIRLFLRSAALWSQARPLSAAVRIAIEPGKALSTVHSLVVRRRDEERLRLVLAAFMRTDQIGAGQTEAPEPGGELAGRFIHPGECRLGLQRETLVGAGGIAIHHNLRLADQLPRLLQTFADLGLPFAYEMQATPWTLPRESLRETLHSQARLAHASGVPRRLLDDQAAFAERLKIAGYHIEECLAAPGPDHVDAVGETLTRLMEETLYAELGAAPRVMAVPEAAAAAFAHHVHSRVMLGTAAETPADMAAAATREEVDRCMSCRALGKEMPAGPDTGPQGAEPLALALDAVPVAASAGAERPAAGGQRPFLFVSYARADRDTIYPLVDSLGQRGASLWIDQRLMGGDDWVGELEAQLMGCSGVLAFISPAFAASRYCQREVRFADALDKRIVPVYLRPVELAGGLNFILHALQRIEVEPGGDCSNIIAALRAHAPAVLAPG